MDVNTRDLSFINFNKQEMQWVKYNNTLVYEAWKTLFASGMLPLTLENCKSADLLDYKIEGNSIQDKYGTINIFNPMLVTATKSSPSLTNVYGTTINSTSYNGNSITVTQTIYSDDVEYEGYYGNGVFYIQVEKEDIIIDKTYTLIADIDITNNLGNKELLRIIALGDTLKSMPMENGKIIVSFVAKTISDKNWLEIRCNGMSFVLSNIMLLEGEVTEAPNYVPCVPNPTPEYPIEVKSVGDKTNNILPFPYTGRSTTTNGATLTINSDSSITSSGTPTGYVGVNLYSGEPIKGSSNTITISIYGDAVNTNVIVNLLDENNTNINSFVARIGEPITINYDLYPTAIKMDIAYRRNSNGKEMSGTSYIMINEGTESLPYEPYGKYRIPVKASGKNLFDYREIIDKTVSLDGATLSVGADGGITGSGIATGYINITPTIKPTLTGKVTFSISGEFNNLCCQVMVKDVNNNTLTTFVLKAIESEFTIDMNKYPTYNSLTMDIKRYVNNVEMSGTAYLQIEKGSTATKYEPYVEPITTNIYLDEPLRKIDEYSDYIDFNNKKINRVVEEKICDGTESWQILNSGKDRAYYYLILGSRGYIVAHKGLNTHFERKTISSSNTNVGYNPTESSTYNDCRILIRPLIDMTTHTDINEWLEFLAEQYNNGTPMTMYYVLATPIEETIELPSIPTLKGTTILDSDVTVQPSKVEVEYMGKS